MYGECVRIYFIEYFNGNKLKKMRTNNFIYFFSTF